MILILINLFWTTQWLVIAQGIGLIGALIASIHIGRQFRSIRETSSPKPAMLPAKPVSDASGSALQAVAHVESLRFRHDTDNEGTMNEKRIADLLTNTHGRIPKFQPGTEVVDPWGHVGYVDVIYADYESAVSSFAVPPYWYERLEIKPKTPKTGFFYSVVLVRGGVLAGEDDLKLAN